MVHEGHKPTFNSGGTIFTQKYPKLLITKKLKRSSRIWVELFNYTKHIDKIGFNHKNIKNTKKCGLKQQTIWRPGKYHEELTSSRPYPKLPNCHPPSIIYKWLIPHHQDLSQQAGNAMNTLIPKESHFEDHWFGYVLTIGFVLLVDFNPYLHRGLLRWPIEKNVLLPPRQKRADHWSFRIKTFSVGS